jgi:hypothetical protein
MPGSAGRGVSQRLCEPGVNVVLSGETCYADKLGVANANIQTGYAQRA